jgi:lipopolysaccharide transport system permease protein
MAVLIIFMLYFKVSLIGLIFYPILLLFYIIFICGISFILAVVGTRITDVANVWRVVVRLGWFATPIFYFINEKSIQSLINPIAHFISAGRSLIINNQLPPVFMMITIPVISLLSLAIGLFIFNSYKNKFAEYV